ncbi:MAG: hypothetical protein JWQ30_2644 [Sediminibacterium sp.]|nr:hypothetical protein [Sediminibacterium sp.]
MHVGFGGGPNRVTFFINCLAVDYSGNYYHLL